MVLLAKNLGTGSSSTQVESLTFRYVAQTFQVPCRVLFESVIVPLSKTNSPTGNLTCKIYNLTSLFADITAVPNSLLYTSTNSLDVSTLTGSDVDITFTFNTSGVWNSTGAYAIVLDATSLTGGSTNNVQWRNGGGVGKEIYSTNGSSWTTTVNVTSPVKFQLYGQQEGNTGNMRINTLRPAAFSPGIGR